MQLPLSTREEFPKCRNCNDGRMSVSGDGSQWCDRCEVPVEPSPRDFCVEENFGKTLSGWWWGVWQDGRLVGFGAGYRNKRTCFSHQMTTAKDAAQNTLPTVKCSNPSIERRLTTPPTELKPDPPTTGQQLAATQLALKVALRQWASYYGERNHCDIESQDDNEALAYRDCASKLSPCPTERG